jgi:hypothetical protein
MKETQILSAKVSTSISSLLSNVTAYAKYFLTSKFPPNYFKKVYISDSLNEIQMEDSNIQKFAKPTLIITPQYTGENGFMELLPYWHTTQYFTFKNPRKKYNGVLYDNINDIYLYSIPDRVKINFEVKIKLDSTLQAYNLLHYLKQTFETGGYFYLNDVRLQTEIPKLYAKVIADRLNIDTETVDGRQALDEYFLQNSYNGIMEKINLSSGNSQFAYHYKTNILTNFPELPSYEKNSNGLVTDNTVISFPFSFEFWSHSNYVMEIKGDVPDTFTPDMTEEVNTMKYDFYIDNTKFIKEQEGNMHMIINKPFLPDVNDEIDVLEFGVIVSSELRDVIEQAVKNKFNMNDLLKVMVLIDNKLLDSLMYEVNWGDMSLTTKNPMSNVTYTLVLYGNLQALNLISSYITDGRIDEIGSLGYH